MTLCLSCSRVRRHSRSWRYQLGFPPAQPHREGLPHSTEAQDASTSHPVDDAVYNWGETPEVVCETCGLICGKLPRLWENNYLDQHFRFGPHVCTNMSRPQLEGWRNVSTPVYNHVETLRMIVLKVKTAARKFSPPSTPHGGAMLLRCDYLQRDGGDQVVTETN